MPNVQFPSSAGIPAAPGLATTAFGAPHRRPAPRWIPLRTLAERHRPRILAHLLALDDADRALRFGYQAGDPQIAHYVEHLDFDRDAFFGVFSRRLELVALAQLAYAPPAAADAGMAEFGASVARHMRGRGLGTRLFAHAVTLARNHHVDTLLIHAASANDAMLRIVRKAGARVEHEAGDATARLSLTADTLGTQIDAAFEQQAGEIDYRVKVQARRFDALLRQWPCAPLR